jgi:hypothetical protein
MGAVTRADDASWLRRRQEAHRLAQADAEALIRDHGAEAHREERERDRDVTMPDGTTPRRPDAGALASRSLWRT